MATVSSNAEVAAHMNAAQQALGQHGLSASSVTQRSRRVQLWIPLFVMVGVFGIAVLAHAALANKFSGETANWLIEKEVTLNTNVFAGVGLVFLVQAILAHVWVVRRLNAPATLSTQAVSPLIILAVPMAVRLATTCAATAYLLVSATASRNEAVCVVFFLVHRIDDS